MLQIRLNDPSQYQSIVDAEWNIIYDKLDKCVQSGAKIVLSRLAIGDLATQYFADRDIFCAGRVSPGAHLKCMYAVIEAEMHSFVLTMLTKSRHAARHKACKS